MQISGAPTKIAVPFADSGAKNSIPVAASATPGLASFTTGFPPVTMTPLVVGGIPPAGQDFNGILNAITQGLRWQMAGGGYAYDSAFAAAVGGYPKGAMIQNASGTGFWISSVDNNSTNPDTGGAGWVAAFPSGAIGQSRNAKMSITTASASGTFAADQIVVGTALSGQTYRLAAYSQTINLAATGAGGMDSGAAPASGFVALYAIYNPTTGAASILAVNASSTVAPVVYAGVNMPAGYTASALLAVLPTDGTGKFVIGYVSGRVFRSNLSNALATTTTTTTPTQFTIGNVPKNATRIFGNLAAAASSSGAPLSLTISMDANAVGPAELAAASLINYQVVSPFELDLAVPQTAFYTMTVGTGTITGTIIITGYEIG